MGYLVLPNQILLINSVLTNKVLLYTSFVDSLATICTVLSFSLQYSMQLNLEPSKDLYLAAKKDLGFLFILLFTGLVCIVPVGYAIAR